MREFQVFATGVNVEVLAKEVGCHHGTYTHVGTA